MARIKRIKTADNIVRNISDYTLGSITGAAVDQIIRVSAVDAQGTPTAWSLSDLGQIHSDTTANWNSQRDLIAQANHIYIYTDYETVDGETLPGVKIGDGSAYLIDMPFIAGNNAALMEHVEDRVAHITAEERAAWNNKVRCYISASDDENIIFTTN